jgi:transposase
LLCFVTAAAAVLVEADADASLRDALEANQRWEQCAVELWAENERLREELARRDAELEQVKAALAVLQRMVFGRSSERTGSQVGGGSGDAAGDAAGAGEDRGPARRRGRAGNARRDYSHLPRVEVIWDFEDGGYCCQRCGTAFESLGDHVIEQIDWHVSVRLVVHRRRRYRRRCRGIFNLFGLTSGGDHSVRG